MKTVKSYYFLFLLQCINWKKKSKASEQQQQKKGNKNGMNNQYSPQIFYFRKEGNKWCDSHSTSLLASLRTKQNSLSSYLLIAGADDTVEFLMAVVSIGTTSKTIIASSFYMVQLHALHTNLKTFYGFHSFVCALKHVTCMQTISCILSHEISIIFPRPIQRTGADLLLIWQTEQAVKLSSPPCKGA